MYNKLLVIKENIIVEKEDDVYIVRNTESGKMFFTNAVGAFILKNGNKTIDMIKEKIQKEFSGVDNNTLLAEVNEFITECINKRVISFE